MPITVRHEWKGAALFANLKAATRAEFRKLAPEVKEWCQDVYTPVDTGALRSTIVVDVARQGVRITISAGGIAFDGTDVDYAHWVHDGTDRVPARPFVTWTLADWTPEFRRAVARAWKSLG